MGPVPCRPKNEYAFPPQNLDYFFSSAVTLGIFIVHVVQVLLPALRQALALLRHFRDIFQGLVNPVRIHPPLSVVSYPTLYRA